MRKKLIVSLVMLGVFLSGIAVAEERTSHVEGWEFVVAPYLWLIGTDGDIALRNTKASADADFGDVWDDLEAGFTGYLEARKDKWGVYGDFSYLRLQNGAKVGPVKVDIETSSTLVEVGVLHRVYEGFAGDHPVGTDVFAGARYNGIDGEIDFAAVPDVTKDKSWIDPIIGAAFSRDMSEKFVVTVSGDIGGFGIGSDFTWSFRILGGYRLSKAINLWFGYRYLDTDYDDGSGANKFEYDVAVHGPIIGASFHF